jgi:hypothetical protein
MIEIIAILALVALAIATITGGAYAIIGTTINRASARRHAQLIAAEQVANINYHAARAAEHARPAR